MKPEWHYEIDRIQKGPVTQQELAEFRNDGVIRDETLIWREGMAGWEPYSRAMINLVEAPPPILNATGPVCANCGRPTEADDLIVIGGQKVCPSCKPLALQRLQEGVKPPPEAALEALRKSHLSHEASVRAIGFLYLIPGVFFIFLMLFGLVTLPSMGGAELGVTQLFFVSLLLGGMGAGYLWVGFGLRKFREPARKVAIVLAFIGLIGFPIGTLINGYFLWLLMSQKGRTVFSEQYARAVQATPHIKYRTSLIAWIALVLILILAAAVIVGMMTSMRS